MKKYTIKPGEYELRLYDNVISQSTRDAVWNYLQDSEYSVNFYDPSHSNWVPRNDEWSIPRTKPAALRLPLAWDEQSLEHRSPIVFKLWQEISELLDHEFIIEGVPESMNYMTGISPLQGITRGDGSPGDPNSAWRVYGDGMDREYRARSKAIHRDNPFLEDDSAYTLVYFANPVWHPQLYGETLFHNSKDTTGDFTGKYERDQPRNFPIGDIENVIAPRPGRIMLWDARYFHQIKPCASYAEQRLLVISFRIRKIKHK
jgi:hypothetical protein